MLIIWDDDKLKLIEYRRWLIFLFFSVSPLSLFSYRQGNSAKWKDIGAKRGIVVGAANVVHITTNFGVSICKACYQLCPKYNSTWHVGFVRPVHSLCNCKFTLYQLSWQISFRTPIPQCTKITKRKVKRHNLVENKDRMNMFQFNFYFFPHKKNWND